MNIFQKIKFILRKPKVIIFVAEKKEKIIETISRILTPNFKVGKDILIFEFTNSIPFKKFNFLIKNSSLPILLVESSDNISEIKKLAKILPGRGYLILNYDEKSIREIKNADLTIPLSHLVTFGFQEGADFQATDIKLNREVNFKLNYQGKVVPIWLVPVEKIEEKTEKEQVYSALAAASLGTILGLNLVEISSSLKD